MWVAMQSGVSPLASSGVSRWIHPMAILGSFSAVRAQTVPSAVFSVAFAYVEDLLREDSAGRARLRGIAPGASERIELGGGVYAVEQVYATKARPDGFFESHRKYIDVQVVVEGDEVIEVIDAARIAAKDPYNGDRDLITYQDTATASPVKLGAGEAAVFYPVDVHMPGLRSGPAPALVRKTVVKVPVSPA